MDFPFAGNVMYLISDNSPENGGTRLIPALQMATLDYKTANSEEIQQLAVPYSAKGSAIVWEDCGTATANRSGSIRGNISTAFLQPWVKPQKIIYGVRDEVLKKMTDKQKKFSALSLWHPGRTRRLSVSAADFNPKKQSINVQQAITSDACTAPG